MRNGRWLIALFCFSIQTARADEPPSGEATAAPPGKGELPAPAPTHAPLVKSPPPVEVPPPPPQLPLAGYGNGTFFLRDPHNWFVLFPKGRLQIDGFTFLNRGDAPKGVIGNSPADPRPRSTLTIRRARVELQGTVVGHFDFHIGGEYATVPGAGSFGGVTDAYVIVDYLSYLKFQVGQFDAPFTMENRTSDKYIDFMERSVAVRAIGAPANKELGAMIFGWAPKRVAYYSFGVFNGDGQNFRNQDNYPALVGRAFVAPVAWLPRAKRNPWLEDLWVGGSVWWQHFSNVGGQAAPTISGNAQDDLPAMTTQGGFGFFSPSFGNGKDGSGLDVRSHLVPDHTMLKWAVEANLPLWRKVGLRFEYMHEDTDLAMYNDTNPMNAKLARSGAQRGGKREGSGLYLEAYGWILGDGRFVETPGIEAAPRLRDLTVPAPRWGLMLAAKYERVAFDVSGLPTTASTTSNPANGHYQLQVFELGLNAWATKHARFTINYVLNHPDGTAGQIKGNYFFDRNEHELLFRAAIAL